MLLNCVSLIHYRNNSVKGLEAFADSANALNRMLLNHLSISEAYNPPTFSAGEYPWEEVPEQSFTPPAFNMEEGDHGLMFNIGDSFDEGPEHGSSVEDRDRAPILWMGLTPPGTSALARRRLKTLSSSGDSMDGDKENQSPPRIPSAVW